MLQTQIEPSHEPEAILLSSGENARLVTVPASALILTPIIASQMQIVPDIVPRAVRVELRDIATEETRSSTLYRRVMAVNAVT